MALTVAVLLVLLSTAGVHAGRSGRTLHQQARTVAPRGPTPRPTSSPTSRPTSSGSGSSGGGGPTSSGGGGSPVSGGSSGGSGSPVTVNPNGIFDPLGPSPFKETECKVLPQGQTYIVNGFPSSPFPTAPFVFKQPFKRLQRLAPTIPETCAADGGHCITGYEVNINEIKFDFGLTGTQCAGASVPMLAYNSIVPGPLVVQTTGHPHVTRFTHNYSPNSPNFPPGGPGNAGSEETKDLCRDRAERMPHYPNITRAFGRAHTVHHHGEASTADMDGWAEQFFCAGESKDYLIPNNRAATLWHHDHAVGITSENVYDGLLGMNLVEACSAAEDPFAVEGGGGIPRVIQTEMILGDYVLTGPRAGESAGQCHLLYDRLGVHQDDLWGDINAVNAIPWPVLALGANWNRFRILAASVSRPWILQLWDQHGAEVSSKICKIIGADGGFAQKAKNWPVEGMLTDVAYRWDVVCDFTAYANSPLYLINKPNATLTTSLTPYFCHSHLVMRIDVGAPVPNAPAPNLAAINEQRQKGPLPQAILDAFQARALREDYDRELVFGRGGGIWVFNGRGWDYKDPKFPGKPHIEFEDVGQNTIELWSLKAGGGWIHPIHVHLVDFFCLAYKADGGLQKCPQEYDNVPKDVMHIGANVGEVIIAARYGPSLGEYMLHCHNNVHEDHEMMRAFMVSDSIEGPAFGKTPPFNVSLLADDPVQRPEAEWGDWRGTTYETAAAPPFTAAYAVELLNRGNYHIFYPRAADDPRLRDPTQNFWLPECPAPVAG